MNINKKAQHRLLVIAAISIIITCGIIMSLYFASDNIVFFLKPSELTEKHMGKKIRVGGLVAKGSIRRMADRVTMFNLTDNSSAVAIAYRGILPTLFREEQGIVAEGIMQSLDGTFVAEKLLTKHDENYKPPVKDSI